jgi:sialate O-acetylesterase
MIADWRKAFAQPDLPFLFVQIAPFRYDRHPSPEFGAELWDAQLHTLKTVSNTGMAVINDIGNVKDIHPTNKHDVGKRLALWARATVYGEKDLAYSGPLFKSHRVEGDSIVISFDHAQGLKARDGKALSHFEIAGEDKAFKPAEARVVGDTVVVSSKEVPKPVAVRFAWRDDAEPNLVNGAGLPAPAFRTDASKWLTEGTAY